jgi:hypothetical protein
MIKIATPAGKVGYVSGDSIAPLGNDQLCYVKDAADWKIAALSAASNKPIRRGDRRTLLFDRSRRWTLSAPPSSRDRDPPRMSPSSWEAQNGSRGGFDLTPQPWWCSLFPSFWESSHS